MGNFDPAAYETVDSRIRKFYGDHEDGRITTELIAMEGDVGKSRWVVKASVWRDRHADEHLLHPDGTGYAFEVDGSGMANKTSALENCETSAIGRALANIGYSGDKRASREEMQKVQRAEKAPVKPKGPSKAELEAFLKVLADCKDMQALRGLHKQASESGWLPLVTDQAGTTVEYLLWARKSALEAPEVES